MPFQIRHDGKTYTVHTEVDEGVTRVEFTEDEAPRPEPSPMEASE